MHNFFDIFANRVNTIFVFLIKILFFKVIQFCKLATEKLKIQ